MNNVEFHANENEVIKIVAMITPQDGAPIPWQHPGPHERYPKWGST